MKTFNEKESKPSRNQESSQSRNQAGKIRLNLERLIKTLGESLYSNPEVSIRELIQNANDSCVHRRANDSKYPDSEIYINIDPFKRQLIVQDNGSGMTWSEVEEFLSVIGTSRTALEYENLIQKGEIDIANKLIGRFGLGLLSAFIIGDKIRFDTYSFKEGSKPIFWECEGDQDYQMGELDEDLNIGTKVTIDISPKFFGVLNSENLMRLIRLHGDLLQLPIYLHPHQEPINTITAPWDYEDYDEQLYRDFLQERFPYDEIIDIIPIKIYEEEGKFQINGILFFPRHNFLIVKEHGDVVLYVKRMLVSAEEKHLLPDWARFVKGVINTTSLQESTSRESVIHDESFNKVQNTLGKIILDYLEKTADQKPEIFQEIIYHHNVIIKAWALVSDELFESVKDRVSFRTDAGNLNLPRYFQMTQNNEGSLVEDTNKKSIFYFTTPGGAGQHSILFSARGLRVIDASNFPDEAFLRKYSEKDANVDSRSLDAASGYIFEDIEIGKAKWIELEEVFESLSINAKVVRYDPLDIPAVLIFSDLEPLSGQIENLLTDTNISLKLKDLIRQMYDERKNLRSGRLVSSGTLYLNSSNSILKSLIEMDIHNQEVQEVMISIYHNALMLSAQGSNMKMTSINTKKIFEGNNRTLANLMSKIGDLARLKQNPIDSGAAIDIEISDNGEGSNDDSDDLQIPDSSHIICFVSMPFNEDYNPLLESLKNILELPPYCWEVARADHKQFARNVSDNVSYWIKRAHCYIVDISDVKGNVMMELGHAYWGMPDRPLLVLQREGTDPDLIDLADTIRLEYPWGEQSNFNALEEKLHSEISKMEYIKKLKTKTNAHFLSERLMMDSGANAKVIKSIADKYSTVEDFLESSDKNIYTETGIAEGFIAAIKKHVIEKCKI